MLKISQSDTFGLDGLVLRLEGQVAGPWVDELRRSCEAVLRVRGALTLDLTDVSFVDIAGVALCQSLQNANDRQVTLIHCSAFVAEQLKGRGI
jgi:ABC-type transporter Mla MlaB component